MVKNPRWLLGVCLYAGCMDNNQSKIDNDGPRIINIARDSVIDHKPEKLNVRASAWLIYEDGSLSAFDVLNDDTVMLWNAVAGGGDVLKPSNSTKFIVSGEIDSLNIQVKMGDKLAFEKKVNSSDNKFEFIVKGTGCTEIFISITKNKNLILSDTIPFHCGE